MEFLRKSLVSLACFILFTSLACFGAILAIRQVVGQPAPIENALAQANAYNAVVTNFIQINKNTAAIGVPLTLPAAQTAVQKAFPESVVEPALNQIISASYAWAQGKTKTIIFRIDLTNAKNNLANYVQQTAEQQAAKLPTCTYNQLLTLSPESPLSVTCLPPDITSTEVGNEAKQALLTSSFLKNPVLTPSSLNIGNGYQLKLPETQSNSNKTTSLPNLYHRLIESLYASAITSLICILAIIWLHRNHLRGLGRAAATIGLAGFACLVDAMLIDAIPNWIKNSKYGSALNQQTSGSLGQVITKISTILADDLHRWLLDYGVTLFIVGLLAWGGITIWLHRKKQQAPLINTDMTAENTPIQTP